MPHPNEEIQEKACLALRELTINYFPVGENGPSDRLQKRLVDKYLSSVSESENPACTRGFALAFGYLPAKLLAPCTDVLDSIICCLCRISHFDAKVGTEKDAETRRNALIALRQVISTVGIEADLRGGVNRGNISGMNAKQVSCVFDAFFAGLEDYNVDRRGDVGSWCRIEAMKGLETIAYLVVEQTTEASLPLLLDSSMASRMIGSLLKQLSEKLDNARVEAGSCLHRILTKQDPAIPFIPEKDYLEECFSPHDANQNMNWSDASVTFPMVAKAATVDIYFSPIIAGMVISVGGLTESVAKQSCASLLQLVKQAKGSKRISELGNSESFVSFLGF